MIIGMIKSTTKTYGLCNKTMKKSFEMASLSDASYYSVTEAAKIFESFG